MADRRESFADGEETLRAAMDARAANMWTATPGIVESYDPAAQTVSVQVALQMMVRGPDGKQTPQSVSVLPDVPVCFPRAGGFAVTFPVKPGDECLVVFGMRCIDSWWQGGGVQPPMDARMHDPSDGFAIFGPTSQPRRLNPPPSGENLCLRTDSGSASIELSPAGRITLKAPGGIEMQSPTAVQMSAPGLTVDGEVTGKGVALSGHVHAGVRAGGETSGRPVQ